MATVDTIEIVLNAKTADFKKKVQAAQKEVTKFGKKANDGAKKAVSGNKNLQKSFTNVAGSIAAVQGPLGPVAGRITAIGAILGRVSLRFALLSGAATLAGLAFVKFVKNTMQTQTQLLKLEGILKATGNAAGLSLTEIEDLSREIGIATLASTGKVRDAAGILLTFKSIAGDVFKDTLRLSQDLAEVGFGDLKTGATQLGKALEDPITGLGALRRVGVSFTDQQKEQIKVLTMTGRKVEAQRLILKALDEQVGGAGVKAAGGLAGALDSLGENFDLLFEQTKFGTLLMRGFAFAVNGVADGLGRLKTDAGGLKTIKQVNEELEKYEAKLKKQGDFSIGMSLTGIFPGIEFGETSKIIGELKERLKELQFELNRTNVPSHIGKQAKEQVKEEHILQNLREESVKKFTIDSNRQIALLGKTAREQAKLNAVAKLSDDLYKKLGSTGKLSQKEVEEQVKKGTEALEEQIDKQHVQIDLQTQLDKVATTVGGTFASVGDKIADAMARGKLHTLDFTSILQEIVVELQKMIIKVMLLDEIQRKIEERIKGSSRGGGISLGGILKTVGGIFTGGSGTSSVPGHIGKASGGTVQPNTPTLVGERGPELFVPGAAGTIKNNSDSKNMMGGGSGVNITQNLNFAVGITNTVRAEVMNMLPAIQNSTISAVADAKQRGGKFSKAFGN